MTTNKFYTGLLSLTVSAILVGGVSCTKLNANVYSVVPNADFWQTTDQINAGVEAAYSALQALPSGNTQETNEASSDELVIPIRGGDWLDNNVHVQEWQHNWPDDNTNINGAWGELFNGITKCNFTLSVVEALPKPPANLVSIVAELKTLRDYFYFRAMDMFGNVPYITSYNVNPNTVTNVPMNQIFDSLVADLQTNIPNLSPTVDITTYGRITQWFGWSLLAKLYMNAQVYTATGHVGTQGTAMWSQAIAACDNVINSGQYSLLSDYFDNFSSTNSNLSGNGNETILAIPFDAVNIGGMNWEMQTLHYQNQINFGLSGQPWNGFCSNADFYSNFDTTSIYATKGSTTYRTFLDQRSGQYLIGQQYSPAYTYPPSTNVITNADPSLAIDDAQFSIPLIFTPTVSVLSNPAGSFRGAGVRNIKYFPQAATAGSSSNDFAVIRYADILLLKAEAEVRSNTNVADALNLVNQVRTRAYSGDVTHNITAGQLTLDYILAERGRELAWEIWRRTDLIRYEVASGTPYFTGPRTPQKTQDPDSHTMNFPIPTQQISANAKLVQNWGY